MATEGCHIASPVLVLCNGSNPAHGVLTLQVSKKQVMNTSHVRNKILTCEWCSINHSLGKHFIDCILCWVLILADNIRQWETVDIRDHQQILVDKGILPLWPFLLIFELASLDQLLEC